MEQSVYKTRDADGGGLERGAVGQQLTVTNAQNSVTSARQQLPAVPPVADSIRVAARAHPRQRPRAASEHYPHPLAS